MPRSPHDALFRHAFTQVEHATGLFRAILPPALVAKIHWPSLVLRPGSFVDKRLREEHSDLLWSAPIAGESLLLHLVTEHKAKSVRWAVLQLNGYVNAIWRTELAANPRLRRLPLVVPILLHHGRRRWAAPRTLEGLLAGPTLPTELRELLYAVQPKFAPIVVSMADWPAQHVRSLGLTVFGKLVCEALQRLPGASPDEVLATLRGWRDLVAAMASASSALESLQALWTYVLRTAEGRPEPVIEVVDELMEAEFMTKRKTAADYLLEAGQAKGRVEGRVELLLTLLTERFGAVRQPVRERLQRGSAADLARWAVRVLRAETLDDVFAAD
jgi:hypothetical protein